MSELWPLIEKYKEARSYDWDVSEKLSAIKAIDSFIEAKERELSEAKERIETVRKKAWDDALETVKRCEQKSGNCVMVHSLMRHDVCNEENCSSFRAMKDQPSGEQP